MAPDPEPEPKQGNRALPWMIATGVAAVVAVAGIGWGVTQKQSADTAAQQSQAEVAALKAQNEREQQTEANLQAELDKAQAEYSKVEQKYQTKKADLQNQTGRLNNLERQYKRAQKDADRKQATLRDELQAAQAKSALATKCAQVMATGMTLIYDSDTPEKVMSQVVRQMDKAARSCDGVVSVG